MVIYISAVISTDILHSENVQLIHLTVIYRSEATPVYGKAHTLPAACDMPHNEMHDVNDV